MKKSFLPCGKFMGWLARGLGLALVLMAAQGGAAAENITLTVSPGFDVAKEIKQLTAYYRSIPDLQYSFTYGPKSPNSTTGNFIYSQGRYLVELSNIHWKAAMAYDGKRYTVLMPRSYRAVDLGSKADQFEGFDFNCFQENPLFNPVEVFFARDQEFSLAAVTDPAMWQALFNNATVASPDEAGKFLFKVQRENQTFLVLETLGDTGLPSKVQQIDATPGSPPDPFTVFTTITKTKEIKTPGGTFILPLSEGGHAVDAQGKFMGSGVSTEVDEASIKLLEQPLEAAYFTIPILPGDRVFDVDANKHWIAPAAKP
jgi:hypothetical protein